MPRLDVFKWRKFILGLSKIGQLIQIEMGTQEQTHTAWRSETPTLFAFRKDSGLEV